MSERFPIGFWLLTLGARGLGGVKEVLLAMVLGTSPWKDALVVAWTAPALMASYCNETLPALLTPAWARQGRGDTPGLRRLVAVVVGLQLGLSAAIAIWPGWLIAGLAPGLSGPTQKLAIQLERWLALNIALLGMQTLLTARLNSQRRFGWTPSSTGLAAAAILLTLARTRGMDLTRRMTWIAAGITVGNALALALLALPLAGGNGRAHAIAKAGTMAPARRANLGSPSAALWRSMGALLLAMLVINLVPLAERMAASGLPAGSLAAYDYGERLVQLVFSLSVAPFTAVCFTRLSELAPVPDALRWPPGPDFARQFEHGLGGLLTLILPVAVAMAIFAPLCTRCIYGWGQFDASSLIATAPVVAIKGAGLGIDAVFYFLVFTIYSRGAAQAKLPIALALAGANVPLAFWCAARWGLAGLAGAHLLGYSAALAWIAGRRQTYLPGLHCGPAIWSGAKAGTLTLLAAGLVHALLPAAALAGERGGLASWGWALLALALTGGGTAGLARWLAPELGQELRQALWPPIRSPGAVAT